MSVKATSVAALAALKTKINEDAVTVEPYVAAELTKILEIAGEKPKKDAVMETAEALLDVMNPFGISMIMQSLIASLGTKAKPTQKEVALKLVTKLGKKEPEFVGKELTNLISIVSDLMNDVKKEVATAARET